ncbi:hypothetical protein [Leptospira kanakyensis]|uniref:hypothetical protein n=1 Tax=Leptospira kanakyensis TaxID=2484968 RepID=UPI00223E3A1E|nr:hypothetical protein [Leptospira kanakyensis]MCW7469375.1 hypothetical protein [Leptospira kanakyensis]
MKIAIIFLIILFSLLLCNQPQSNKVENIKNHEIDVKLLINYINKDNQSESDTFSNFSRKEVFEITKICMKNGIFDYPPNDSLKFLPSGILRVEEVDSDDKLLKWEEKEYSIRVINLDNLENNFGFKAISDINFLKVKSEVNFLEFEIEILDHPSKKVFFESSVFCSVTGIERWK